MIQTILGKKVGMTQVYDGENALVPVTVVEAGPCPVVQVKTVETDGYNAVQLGFGPQKEQRLSKAEVGHAKKAGVAAVSRLSEVRLASAPEAKTGDIVTVEIFKEGQLVDVTGETKGKGFQGVIKRWNQARGKMTHGSHFHRAPGSMSANSSPSRVFKHKNLPGHMGNETVTVQNLEVVRVDAERNLLLVKGAVPGPKGGLVSVTSTVK